MTEASEDDVDTETSEVDDGSRDTEVETSAPDDSGGSSADEADVERDEDVDVLRARVEELEETNEEYESRIKRLQADLENYRRRAEQKIERARESGVDSVVEALVDVRDDLERALESEGDVREGVRMTVDAVDRELERLDVERVDVSGEMDPELHEAVMQVESTEHDEGEVVEVYEHGYVRGDRVLREARVSVAAGGADAGDVGEDSGSQGEDEASDE